jgi:hypothetical protein
MPTLITVTRSFSVPALLDIADPEFAHWYELGVFWAMYGDYQGNGPYDDRYLIENVSRNIQASRYDNLSSPWFTSLGFYLGMLHGGWLAKPSDALVVLTDPDFTAGYQQGCQHERPLTADTLMRTIHQWALSRLTGQTLAYELGVLTGSLAQALIPAVLQTV